MSTGPGRVPDAPSGSHSSGSSTRPAAAILWDHQNCIPLDRIPLRHKPVLLLTPAVVPPHDQEADDDRDPFEILGQLLSSRNIPIRHVPYTRNQGITGVHVAFIKRSRAVIFVITGPSQREFSDLAARICESRPLIVVACRPGTSRSLSAASLRTVIQTTGYSKTDLQATAALLLDGDSALTVPRPDTPRRLNPASAWLVQPWDAERDLVETHALWLACIPRKFHLSISALASLLRRAVYALHHVVREPAQGTLVGFCATYICRGNSPGGGDLIGSMAAIIVRARHRGQGIGSILHDTAVRKLQGIWGVQRIQLGTAFPRLLRGLPVESTPIAQWFGRRGWPVEEPRSKDRFIADWVLQFSDLSGLRLTSAGLVFRPCGEQDAQRVMDMVNSPSAARSQYVGLYDQYARTMNSGHMHDIVVGFEGTTIVATAITYIPSHGGPTVADIPWPGTLGSDLGGVTCIYIIDDAPEVVNRRDTVMVRLLYACYKTLSERGMAGKYNA